MASSIHVITAQQTAIPNSIPTRHIEVFLAGGISGCRNWQEEVIDKLGAMMPLYPALKRAVLINPRNPEFDVDDPGMAFEQIKWEHDWLSRADIVSYFFDNSESLQPITLYELGKWANKKQSVITVCNGYKRQSDVYIQTTLDGLYCGMYDPEDAIDQHARSIAHAVSAFQRR